MYSFCGLSRVDASCVCVCSDMVVPFLRYQVEGVFYVNDALEKLMFEELRNACRGGGKYIRVVHVVLCLPFSLEKMVT